jgi:uncharacterized integral membrane protein
MSKKILWALVIMAICVVLLIFNRGTVKVDLLVGQVEALKSLVFLIFLGVGVLVGLLLK